MKRIGYFISPLLLIALILFFQLNAALLGEINFFIICIACFVGILSVFLLQLNMPANSRSFSNLMVTNFGLIYIGFFLTPFILLAKKPQGNILILYLISITWLNDIGAYIFGHLLGKHKLSPVISPNKTIEGAAGGILFSILTALMLGYFFSNKLTIKWYKNIVLALSISILAQLGDLTESFIKRSALAKDSGNIISITGHGGMLDVVDSLLFTTPFFYFFYNCLW